MTKAEEKAIKLWLFNQWKSTNNPKFFLAGAVIGKVDNIFELAEKNDIDCANTGKFLDGVGICSALPIGDYERDWMIHILCDWANDKSFSAESYIIPSNIRALLNRVRLPSFRDLVVFCGRMSDADRFYDKRLNIFTKFQQECINFEKRLEICVKEQRNINEKYLVAKSTNARKFEDVLRALFVMIDDFPPLNPKFAKDNEKFVKYQLEHFFADKIKNSTTAQDIFSLWILMLSKLKDVNEILDSLIEQLADASDDWLRFNRDRWERFFDFVSNWKKFRKAEISKLETKAKVFDVNLKKMFDDALAAELAADKCAC